jgi:hypothetical protein
MERDRHVAREPRVRARLLALAFVPLTVGLTTLRASADIGPTCPSIAPPRDEEQAIHRSAFAFNGVIVGGRPLPGTTDGTLISPLVVRVVDVLKSLDPPGSYGRRSSAGDLLVTVWDAVYYRAADRADAVGAGSGPRFPGEIEASDGQLWRIYVDREGGVNFTATTCLGSHQISRASTSPASPRPRLSIGPLLLLATIPFLAGALLLLRRRKTRRFRVR